MTTGKVKIGGRWRDSTGGIILWLAIACFLGAAIAFSWNPTPFAQVLAAIFIASALAHASVAYGFGSAAVLFFICIAITFIIENVGVAIGFLFRRYYFDVDPLLSHFWCMPS